MHNYIEFFDSMPVSIVFVLMILFGLLQGIGEILEFKGKVVPEFLKVRKYFKRKREERIALSKITDMWEEHEQMSLFIKDARRLLADLDKHYSNDNITMRDKWMKEVNEHITSSEEKRKEQDDLMRELNAKLDKNNDVTLSILIENKRSAIIDFASKVIDDSYPVTREQFNRAFKTYREYEEIIEEHQLTNGEVDIAIHIIQESYEQHMKKHTFIEDVRGYNV